MTFPRSFQQYNEFSSKLIYSQIYPHPIWWIFSFQKKSSKYKYMNFDIEMLLELLINHTFLSTLPTLLYYQSIYKLMIIFRQNYKINECCHPTWHAKMSSNVNLVNKFQNKLILMNSFLLQSSVNISNNKWWIIYNDSNKLCRYKLVKILVTIL